MTMEATETTLPVPVQERQLTPQAVLGATPIVPPDTVTGRSLTIVIAIMCFLVSLTAGFVYMIQQSASAWLRDIQSEITVQISPDPRGAAETDKKVAEIADFLKGQIGIAKVTVLSSEDVNALVSPWLGKLKSFEVLPMPRLLAIEIDRANPPDIVPLKAALEARFADAALDDHRRWRRQIQTLTSGLAFAGLAVILLVAAATVAIVIAAARSAMASNRSIIEVLNFVGAEERFIVRQFETHFFKLGVKAGLVGASAAAAVFVLMPLLADYFGGASATDAEIRRFIGSGTLDLTGYLILVLMVGLIAVICLLTSHFGVKRILEAQNR